MKFFEGILKHPRKVFGAILVVTVVDPGADR